MGRTSEHTDGTPKKHDAEDPARVPHQNPLPPVPVSETEILNRSSGRISGEDTMMRLEFFVIGAVRTSLSVCQKQSVTKNKVFNIGDAQF